ncbi:hypothetical protein [Streptomyces chartreusis]|uniref:hypothetical protein n=1 Tax=Streptomyces chartreusis TaxID=1969 RepID=UPI003653329D
MTEDAVEIPTGNAIIPTGGEVLKPGFEPFVTDDLWLVRRLVVVDVLVCCSTAARFDEWQYSAKLPVKTGSTLLIRIRDTGVRGNDYGVYVRFHLLCPYYTTLGIVSRALSGLNAHWTAATMAEEYGRLRVAADDA